MTRLALGALTLSALLAPGVARADPPPHQVQVEVKLTELPRTQLRELGFDWSATGPGPREVPPPPTPAESKTPLLGDLPMVGSLFRRLARDDEKVQVLAAPKVTVMNGRAAIVEFGSPGSASEPAFGFQLYVIPTVSPDGKWIRLDLRVGTDQLRPPASAPVIERRESRTSVRIPDGGTMLIGGLATEETERLAPGVPWLSRIPVLGDFFRRRGSRGGVKQTLLVFVTPRILRDGDEEGSGGGGTGSAARPTGAQNPLVNRPTSAPDANLQHVPHTRKLPTRSSPR